MPGNPLGEIASLMNLTTDLREASCFPLEVSIKEGSLNPHSHDSYKIWLFLAVHLTSKTMLIPNSFNCVEGEPIVHFCMYFLFLLTQLSLDSIHIIWYDIYMYIHIQSNSLGFLASHIYTYIQYMYMYIHPFWLIIFPDCPDMCIFDMVCISAWILVNLYRLWEA